MRKPRPNKRELNSSHLMRLANLRETCTPGEQLPPGVLSTLRVCLHAGISTQQMAMALDISLTDVVRELRRGDRELNG